MWGCVSDLPKLRQPSRRLLRGSDVHKIIIKSLTVGPALTRKNILSDKNSHQGEKNLIT